MSTKTGTTTYTHPSDNELQAVRTFDAPRELVFSAMTDPKHVPHWMLGPDGWSMPICESDLRVGGAYKYVYRNDTDGSEFFFSGEYLEVAPPERLAMTELFNGEEPGSVNTCVLSDEGGRTTMTLTMRFPSKDVKEMVLATGMTGGADISYDRLDSYLSSLA